MHENHFLNPPRVRARECLNEKSEDAVANRSPALNPNPPKLVTRAQIKAAHNGLAVSEAQEQVDRSPTLDCETDTEASEARG